MNANLAQTKNLLRQKWRWGPLIALRQRRWTRPPQPPRRQRKRWPAVTPRPTSIWFSGLVLNQFFAGVPKWHIMSCDNPNVVGFQWARASFGKASSTTGCGFGLGAARKCIISMCSRPRVCPCVGAALSCKCTHCMTVHLLTLHCMRIHCVASYQHVPLHTTTQHQIAANGATHHKTHYMQHTQYAKRTQYIYDIPAAHAIHTTASIRTILYYTTLHCIALHYTALLYLH